MGAHREALAQRLRARVSGAIASRVTSPPCASISLSAASSAYSSLPLMTAGEAARIEPAVGPEALDARAGSGTGLARTTMCTAVGFLPGQGRSSARSARATTSRWICCVPS